jgi:hypothetical protein
MSTPTRRWIHAVVTGLLVVAGVGGLALSGEARQEPSFPHDWHEGLFPVCTGCHAGVAAGDEASFYPSPDLCARCHDGVDHERVSWTPPAEETSNLKFSHPTHAAALASEGDPAQTCEQCHSDPDGGRMSVDGHPQLATCFSCHEHQAQEHYEDADCATCHKPLAESGFSTPRIRALPVPEDHQGTGFVLEAHGAEAQAGSARCATCHTRERCAACHVDATRPAIQQLPAAPQGMELPPAAAHYPVPASHSDEGWLSAHGRQAQVGQCSTCHVTEDCAACHRQPVPDLVAALPSREDVQAPGVGIARHAPESHASAFFQEAHGTLASADGSSCATCHQESFCVACHEGPSDGGYHPANFVARHSAVAYGRDAECATCHNTTVFCRTCHVENGMGSQGRLGPGYHDAEPVWLLRHGQAARQNLESCTSCHKQRECMQCHSTLGSFQISPHPADFDAEAAWARNPRTCLACHISDPTNGGSP